MSGNGWQFGQNHVPAPGGTRLLDRPAAPLARFALAAVDLELVLHPAGAAVRRAVVAECRALARDAGLERCSNAAVKRSELVLVELPAGRWGGSARRQSASSA